MMLTLIYESWLLWLLTSALAISLVALLASCVCGCRKTVPKSELMGLAGMVKITNPEESLNHNIGDDPDNANVPCTVITSGRSCSDITDTNRRTSTTANRSLPEIPIDSERMHLSSSHALWESSEPNGDTCSELYATVEENKTISQPSVSMPLTRGGKHSIATTSDDGKSSEHSSLSQTDDSFSPYAQLKAEHPYDQLKKSEHPYAQVGSSSSDHRDNKSETSTNPVPPPRTRKSNSFNSLVSTPDTGTAPSTSINIPAATAIAGRISANQELPYMTPPIPTPAMVPDPQLHFSGDSQDSSKGYTSISVREPLANIKAQTRQRSRIQELSDSFYATVSDDSEEMYAAIEEPGQVYTSGSDTYAQIQPPLMPAAAPQLNELADSHQLNSPQPPSVDSLKQVAHVHSRQASSSSAASSVVNLGSPKPGKRQANSPLPPPPAGSPELYATVDKKTNREHILGDKSLEEMYAKVMKKKHKGLVSSTADLHTDSIDQDMAATTSQEKRLSSIEVDSKTFFSDMDSTNSLRDNNSSTSMDMSSSRESMDTRQRMDSDTTSNSSSNPNLHFDITRKEPTRSFPTVNSVHPVTNYNCFDELNSIPYIDPGYEIVQRGNTNPPSDTDPNYEELHPKVNAAEGDFVSYHSVNSDKGSSGEPGYASIDSSHERSTTLPGYESIGRSRNRNSAGYESVGQVKDLRSGADPGYEQVGTPSGRDGYALVNKRKSKGEFENKEDSNYESVGHSNPESTYTGGSESDPNYEVVRHDDPNYESVNYSDLPRDPPYERLHNESRDSDSETVPGYERVNRQPSKPDTEYEEVDVRV